MRIVHVITGLGTGGAEMMLLKLARALHSRGHRQMVVSLTGQGPIADRLRGSGIPVVAAEIHRLPRIFHGIRLAARAIRSFHPDLVQSWMYHADVVAAAVVPRDVPLIWNVRHALHDIRQESWSVRLIIAVAQYLSYRPEAIVFNSMTAREHHVLKGYPQKKSIVIPNGFDTNLFFPSEERRQAARSDWRVPDDAVVIGNIARYHPVKNHNGLVKAFAKLCHSFPQKKLFLVMAGKDIIWSNEWLAKEINRSGAGRNIILLGPVAHPECVIPGFDVYVSPSFSEGFPNVMGEAMACGVPCIATDVGDSRFIVGRHGFITERPTPDSLHSSLAIFLKSCSMNEIRHGESMRQSIQDAFSIEAISNRYMEVYEDVIQLT